MTLPDSSIHGIFEARIRERVAISFPRGSCQPRNQTCISYVSCIAGKFVLVSLNPCENFFVFCCGGCLLYFFFSFLFCFEGEPCQVACVILIPRPGIDPAPPALQAWSLNHWITREVPRAEFLRAHDVASVRLDIQSHSHPLFIEYENI